MTPSLKGKHKQDRPHRAGRGVELMFERSVAGSWHAMAPNQCQRLPDSWVPFRFQAGQGESKPSAHRRPAALPPAWEDTGLTFVQPLEGALTFPSAEAGLLPLPARLRPASLT